MRRPEFVARQSACPSGLLGRLIGAVMARETASANQFALQLLDLHPTDHVLEVGFGHGVTIARLAAAVSGGFVAGVDPSAGMCRMASRRNRDSIVRKLVDLRQGRAEALPYPDGRFDKVLSVHTLYFWREPDRALAEIRRVLKPAGRLVLAWRYDAEAVRSFPASAYRFHDEAGVLRLLRDAGFCNVRVVLRTHEGAVLHLAAASAVESGPLPVLSA